MDISVLRAYLEFSECLNFTQAAQALHITQPALHTKIKNLAQEVGAPLYEKDGRNLRLTPMGVRLRAFANDMVERSDRFRKDCGIGKQKSRIVVAAGEGAYLRIIGEGIRRFLKTKEASLDLQTADQNSAYEAVLSGRAHIGVGVFSRPVSDLKSETLTSVDQVLAMPKGHPLARKRKVRLKDLSRQSLIVPPAGRPARIALEQALERNKTPWRIAIEAGGWDLMVQFVSMGVGLAVVNGSCRMQPGVTARVILDFHKVDYKMIFRRGAEDWGALNSLKAHLRANAWGWRKKSAAYGS